MQNGSLVIGTRREVTELCAKGEAAPMPNSKYYPTGEVKAPKYYPNYGGSRRQRRANAGIGASKRRGGVIQLVKSVSAKLARLYLLLKNSGPDKRIQYEKLLKTELGKVTKQQKDNLLGFKRTGTITTVKVIKHDK